MALQVEVHQIGPSTSQGQARSHTVLIDRPTSKGGADRGPLGGEYLLLSLGGCFMSNLLAAIRARDAKISNVRIALTATVDGSPERFTAITMNIAADHDNLELVHKLIGLAGRGCIVTNTLKETVMLSVFFDGEPVVD